MREGESGGRGSHHKTECFCKQVQELLVARFTYVLELSYEVCYKRSFAISMIDGRSKRFYIGEYIEWKLDQITRKKIRLIHGRSHQKCTSLYVRHQPIKKNLAGF